MVAKGGIEPPTRGIQDATWPNKAEDSTSPGGLSDVEKYDSFDLTLKCIEMLRDRGVLNDGAKQS